MFTVTVCSKATDESHVPSLCCGEMMNRTARSSLSASPNPWATWAIWRRAKLHAGWLRAPRFMVWYTYIYLHNIYILYVCIIYIYTYIYAEIYVYVYSVHTYTQYYTIWYSVMFSDIHNTMYIYIYDCVFVSSYIYLLCGIKLDIYI